MKYVFECVDGHTCGNPVRLVRSGAPELLGADMREKRLYFIKHYDWIRTGLMFEPRGHDLMSGSILYPPHDPLNDAAVLFIETTGCLPMCGHGLIGTVTIAIQEKIITPRKEGVLRLETPAGLVMAEYTLNSELSSVEKPVVQSVKILNVPSFLFLENLSVECSGPGALRIDVAYGGNFYAIVDVQENFKGLEHYPAENLILWARELKRKLNEQCEFVHPEDASIRGCHHILWTGAVLNPNSTARNAVVYGEKAIDRSPCGTGTSARMAQWYAKGKLKKGELFIHESIIGSTFTGRIEEELSVCDYPAIRPSIEGWAKVTGYNTIIIDTDDDPFAHGFQVL
ncbi:MAG: 4-hydroxyproline epimerase [Chitinophagaceae bacterium]|nr:4-hydroxyproline epimerase [Chitinophagaceae bacterium]